MGLTKQKNYQQSFDLACASIKAMDLKERAEKAGAVYQKGEGGPLSFVRRYRCPWADGHRQVDPPAPPSLLKEDCFRVEDGSNCFGQKEEVPSLYRKREGT
jgi:hypothetical protein